MTDPLTVAKSGVIEDVAVLDLTAIKTPDELARITAIRDVAVLLVPESLGGALASIPMHDVATIVPVPDGARVRTHTGVVTMGGDGLANVGGEKTVLVVTGALVVTSPVERIGYHDVVVTGTVVAPRGSESALAAGLSRVTGSVAYYPYAAGQSVKVLAGQTSLSGESLANSSGSQDDILLVAGQLLINSPVGNLGYQQIVVAGQLIAPRQSEALLVPTLSSFGQVVWYTGDPRIFVGKDRFGSGFFELVDEPLSLILLGKFEIEPDVPPELVKEKVAEIVLAGQLRASPALVPVLQLLTKQKQGEIVAVEERGGQPSGNAER